MRDNRLIISRLAECRSMFRWTSELLVQWASIEASRERIGATLIKW